MKHEGAGEVPGAWGRPSVAHIGVASRQPNTRSGRERNHRRRLPFDSALISADTVAASTEPLIRIRPPLANSISTVPARSDDGSGGGRAAIAGSGAIATGWNAAGAGTCLQNCCRHRNSWLACILASRATSQATAPGSSAAAMIRSFSARDQRRRRCTDVITSTCCLVIGLVLGLPLGLAANPQSRKAALAGCLLERSGFGVRCRYAAIIFSFAIGIASRKAISLP